jgi:hypothetical protein
MSLPARSILMWLVLLVVMFGNGLLRVAVLQLRLGEATARQVASLLGVALVFALSGLFVGSLQAPSGAQAAAGRYPVARPHARTVVIGGEPPA